MAKKESKTDGTGYWPDSHFSDQSEQGQQIKDNPMSMIPSIPDWGKPRVEGRDYIMSALLGLNNSLAASRQASQLGDPFSAALAGLAGAATQPGPQALANERMARDSAALMAQFEAMPAEAAAPGLVAKHPEFKGIPLGILHKIAPYIQRNDAMEQQMALFFAAEKGRNARNEATNAAASGRQETRDERATRAEERQLRNELQAKSKDFVTIRDAFAKINEVAKKPTPAGDLSMIYNYMKILDPGSTVRESEFNNAALAAPLLTRLGIDTSKLSAVWEGKRLTPEQRADFLAQAQSIYQSQKALNDQTRAQYRRLAEAGGGKAENVDVIGGVDLGNSGGGMGDLQNAALAELQRRAKGAKK